MRFAFWPVVTRSSTFPHVRVGPPGDPPTSGDRSGQGAGSTDTISPESRWYPVLGADWSLVDRSGHSSAIDRPVTAIAAIITTTANRRTGPNDRAVLWP